MKRIWNGIKMHRRYLLTVFLLSLVLLPVIAQALTIPFLGVGTIGIVFWAVAMAAVCTAFCMLWARRGDLPASGAWRFLPVAAALSWNLLFFAIGFGAAGYQFGNEKFALFVIPTISWLGLHLVCALSNEYADFPAIVLVFYGALAGIFAICLRIQKRRGVWTRRALALVGVVVVLCGTIGAQFYLRSQRVLTNNNSWLWQLLGIGETGDYNELRVEDEINLYDYWPFSKGNLLQRPPSPPSLAIDRDYPRIDGATAAFPVYAAMAQAVYKGLDEESVGEYVDCTKTGEAYERLIAGEIDIFFGAQPSQDQIRQAAERGVEFQLYPIGKEAFVFFVNRDNPVNGLSVAQIQDIYGKKVTNWREVGGLDEKIMPFQRPENSGSQTIMQKIMEGKPLPAPLMEERVAGMGGVINEVATYQNRSGAVGYSFRYFATGMKPNEGIKLLAVEGVEPTTGNIRTESYPFTVDVYAVTTAAPKGNVKRLLDWTLSMEGQALIEQCGYVGIALPPASDEGNTSKVERKTAS